MPHDPDPVLDPRGRVDVPPPFLSSAPQRQTFRRGSSDASSRGSAPARARGRDQPETALFLTVWPPPQLADLPDRVVEHPPELRQRALELVADGVSWAEAAREVGVSKATVGGWVKADALVDSPV